MNFKSIRYNSIIRWGAFTLLTICFVELSVRANPTAINTGTAQDTHVDLYKNIWITGLARGQTLLYTWANPNDPNTQQREFEPLRIQVKLLAADESVIAQTAAAAVGAGQFQSFDFNRDQINLPGEPGTGRLQVRLEVLLVGQLKYPNLVLKQGILDTFHDNLEVIDNNTGQTTFNPKSFQIISAGNDHLTGIIPGQTLRFTVFNPNQPDSRGGHREPLSARLLVTQADGSYIAESGELSIPPGEFRFFDFNRSALPVPGETGTGRLQVRVVLGGTFSLTFTGQTTSGTLWTSWELVDNATGKTELYAPTTSVWYLRNSNSQ